MPTPRKHANHAQRQRAYLERQKAALRALIAAKNIPVGAAVRAIPSTLRWKALSEQAQNILQTLQSEMDAYHDERSEAWQESEKGEAFQETIERVAEALESVQNIGF